MPKIYRGPAESKWKRPRVTCIKYSLHVFCLCDTEQEKGLYVISEQPYQSLLFEQGVYLLLKAYMFSDIMCKHLVISTILFMVSIMGISQCKIP